METVLFDLVNKEFSEFETTFKSLLARNVKVNVRNSFGDTPLHLATLYGNAEIVNSLIKAGARVNLKNKGGYTAFEYALCCGNSVVRLELLKMLVKAGGNVNTVTVFNGKTALHVAAEAWDADFALLLINEGADVDAEDKYDRYTPLHYAAKNIVSEDPRIFEVLLSGGAYQDAKSYKDETPLFLIADSTPKPPTLSLSRIVNVFVEFGADFYAKNYEGKTAIDVALEFMNASAVKAIIYCGGVDVNTRHKLLPTNGTILHWCLGMAVDMPSEIKIVEFLLKNGADVNAVNIKNVSPLQSTVAALQHIDEEETEKMSKGIALIKYLFSWDPDVNIITVCGANILTPDDEGFDLPVPLWQTILEHLAKLRAMKSAICSSLLDTISAKQEYKNYFDKCIRELQIAKISQVSPDNRLTFFNLLTDEIKKLILSTSDAKFITNHITEDIIVERFPIYGSSINEKLLKLKRHVK